MPEAAIRRIDHLIVEVPDIDTSFRRLTENHPVAWPIGRFWPSGLTAGVALGGVNLELLQPDKGTPAGFTTLVFEPTSIEAAMAALEREGIEARIFEKYESDPELLALRGFPPEMTGERQLICRNILVPGRPFFFCAYSDFLRDRLVARESHIHRITVPFPVDVFDRLGYLGEIELVGDGPFLIETTGPSPKIEL